MQKDPARTYLARGAVRLDGPGRADRRARRRAHRHRDPVHDRRPAVGGRGRGPGAVAGLHQGVQPVDLRVLRRRAAARPDRAPVAVRSGRRRRGAGAGRRRGRQGRVRRPVHTTTAARSATPTTTRCSPPPRTSTCRSRSTRRSSRSGRRARGWGRGRTSSSCGCWRRCRRPTACATSSRRCSTTACSTRFPRLKVLVLESGGGWIGYWLDRIDAVYSPHVHRRAGAAGAQAERLLPRAHLDQLRPRRADDPGARRALRRRAVHVGVGLPPRRPHARVHPRPQRARRRRSPSPTGRSSSAATPGRCSRSERQRRPSSRPARSPSARQSSRTLKNAIEPAP